MKHYTQRLEKTHAVQFQKVADFQQILDLYDVESWAVSGHGAPTYGDFTLAIKPIGLPSLTIRRGAFVTAEYSPNEARYRATGIVERSKFLTEYEEAE